MVRSGIGPSIINEIRNNIRGEVLDSEPLSNHTTYRTGGDADLLVSVNDATEAEWMYRFCLEKDLPLKIIGAGSNLIVAHSGIRGIVMKTRSREAVIDFENQGRVISDAGVYLDTLIRELAERGYGGLNCIAGIPGTVGGAVFMNAGTGGGDVSSLLENVEVVTPEGRKAILAPEDIQFGYRSSIFHDNGWLILRAEFRIKEVDRETELNEIDRIWEKRMKLYPMNFPTAGSVFKNPEGDRAGRLLDRAGCGGLKVGDAMISEKHANFIINTGNASSDDILKLIKIGRERVFQKFGIRLELEQEMIG